MSDHERQGSGYDPGASGHELQGRATKPIEAGDVVKSRMGGPLMTVEAIRTGGERPDSANTVWFDTEDHLQRDNFDLSTLVHPSPMDDPFIKGMFNALEKRRARRMEP